MHYFAFFIFYSCDLCGNCTCYIIIPFFFLFPTKSDPTHYYENTQIPRSYPDFDSINVALLNSVISLRGWCFFVKIFAKDFIFEIIFRNIIAYLLTMCITLFNTFQKLLSKTRAIIFHNFRQFN